MEIWKYFENNFVSWHFKLVSIYSIHRLGLDPKLLAKILNMSSGRCWSSEIYNPVPGVLEGVPSSNSYKGGFGTALMTKVCYLFWLLPLVHCWNFDFFILFYVGILLPVLISNNFNEKLNNFRIDWKAVGHLLYTCL